jgi:hypothetical protein
MKWLLFLFLVTATGAHAAGGFHVYSGSTNLIEGGTVETLILINGEEESTLRPPKGWFHEIDDSQRKIIFKNQTGKSALTLQLTTNSPGRLPGRDVLQARVLAEHPGAGILQYNVCTTSSGPGVFFDLVSMPAPQVILKIRHAFVKLPQGQAEFILSSSDDEFEKGRTVFMLMLNSFRTSQVKQNAQ